MFHLRLYDLLNEKYFSKIGSTPSIVKSEFLYCILLNLLFISPRIVIFEGRGLKLISLIKENIFELSQSTFLNGSIEMFFGEKL